MRILTNGCKDHAQKISDQSDQWFSLKYFFKCRIVQIWVGKICMFFLCAVVSYRRNGPIDLIFFYSFRLEMKMMQIYF